MPYERQKVHFDKGNQEQLCDTRRLLFYQNLQLTTDKSEVTCKSCLRIFEKLEWISKINAECKHD